MSRTLSQKLDALQRLSALGMATPPSRVVTCDDYRGVIRSMARAKANHWVVRVSLEQKHLIKKPAYAPAELASVIASVFRSQPDCQLLISKLIPAIRAGIFVRTKDCIYGEHVPGALQSLARDGVTPVRVLLHSDGRVSHIERNVPEFFYSWSGPDLKRLRTSNMESTGCIEDLIEKVSGLAVPCPPSSIIEWVQAPNRQLYAVDLKSLEAGFLGDHQHIHRGLVERRLCSLPRAWEKDPVPIETSTSPGVMFLERPLYSYVIDESAFSASRIVFRAGGLLAHLVVECSHRKIPCMILPDVSGDSQRKGDGTQTSHIPA